MVGFLAEFSAASAESKMNSVPPIDLARVTLVTNSEGAFLLFWAQPFLGEPWIENRGVEAW